MSCEQPSSHPTCSICLEPATGDICKLACNHRFHAACYNEWERRCSGNVTCPNCRASTADEHGSSNFDENWRTITYIYRPSRSESFEILDNITQLRASTSDEHGRSNFVENWRTITYNIYQPSQSNAEASEIDQLRLENLLSNNTVTPYFIRLGNLAGYIDSSPPTLPYHPLFAAANYHSRVERVFHSSYGNPDITLADLMIIILLLTIAVVITYISVR